MEKRKKPNYTIIFRKRKTSERSALTVAKQVTSSLAHKLDGPLSREDFKVTGADRQSRIEVYADLSLSLTRSVLRTKFWDAHYAIEDVRKGME